jgi:dihydrofolate reductase
MGRVTYEALSAYAQMDKPTEGADSMNELPKLVFSRTLEEPLEWNNSRLAEADLADEIRSLKAQPGEPLRTMGSLSVVKELLVEGLVDRLRLIVFPQILGDTGRQPLFADLPDIDLELIDTKILDDRLVTLEYRPATAHQTG